MTTPEAIAADRIEALVKERDDLIHDLERVKDSETYFLNRAKQLEKALRSLLPIAERNERGIATQAARAALEGNTHDA